MGPTLLFVYLVILLAFSALALWKINASTVPVPISSIFLQISVWKLANLELSLTKSISHAAIAPTPWSDTFINVFHVAPLVAIALGPVSYNAQPVFQVGIYTLRLV